MEAERIKTLEARVATLEKLVDELTKKEKVIRDRSNDARRRLESLEKFQANYNGEVHRQTEAHPDAATLLAKIKNVEENVTRTSGYVAAMQSEYTAKYKQLEYKTDVLAQKTGTDFYIQEGTHSKKSITWLNKVAERDKIQIRHAQNGGEREIVCRDESGKPFRFFADGFCEATNTVYEFHGDFWHGNPAIYRPDDYNAKARKNFGLLYRETKRKEQLIQQAGYKLVTIWESEYDAGKI